MKYTISIMSYVLVRLESNYDGLGYSMNIYDIHNQNNLFIHAQSLHFFEYTLQFYNYSL